MKKVLSIALVVIMVFSTGFTYADTKVKDENIYSKVKKVKLSKKKVSIFVGKKTTVKVKDKCSKVKVKLANKKIAKVSVKKKKITIKGKKNGKTSITVRVYKKGKMCAKGKISVIVKRKNNVDSTDNTTNSSNNNKIPTNNDVNDEKVLKKEFKPDYTATDNKLDVSFADSKIGIFEYKVDGLEEGYYYITAYTTYDGNCDYCYLYGEPSDRDKNFNGITSIPAKEKELVTVRGIKVKSDGRLYLGSWLGGGNEGGLKIHSFSIRREINQNTQYNLLMGGALSRINYVESTGAKFYDNTGVQRDPLDIMKENGINFCRLELYNNPGKGRGDGNYYCPEGFQNQEDILKIAKRAKSKGMEIQLSFMLSDFWTYGIPEDFRKDFEGETNEAKIVEILEKDTYEYIKDTMEKMKVQGTEPAYVSIGNEMNGGFYLPYGDSSNHMDNLARFINSGYKAVKEVSSDSKVVLHIGCNADDEKYNGNGTGKWFFDLCEKYNVNYDVIGTSFYPFWAETLTTADLTNWCNRMISNYDKDVLIMETGFNFRKDTETGSRGQLYNMGAYEGFYDYTPEGQRDYMIDLINAIKCVDDGRCVGCLYWDPIMVAGDGIGWSMREYDDKADNNVISNTTWFDFNHRALRIFDAFKYN